MFLVKRQNGRRNRLGLLDAPMDNMFSRLLDEWPLTQRCLHTVAPAIDLMEVDDNFSVRAELPGLTDEDIELSVLDDVLTISGEKKIEKPTEAKYHHAEGQSGKFRREIRLPAPVDTDKVVAGFTNGVLTVTLPKSDKAKARTIKIDK
ncbi:MAG: Hsp20/alpha crystallin family protein [Phycisphaerae bacterium]|jgi:HSP20 family protein|nr:Hsp20/alpha crystallin family protein [Phycisphaerae bacterium]